MSDKVFNIIIRLLKQGGADTETVRGLVDIKNAMTASIAVAGSITAAYYAVDQVLKQTVGTLVTSTQGVEKFRNETGMTAEGSSRLLVVLNDLGISAGDVETAFKYAEKNGFRPSIASLEEMQKQYLALNPGMERTQFLVQQFGKGGLTLQKFFETGDTAERLAAVNRSLVISVDTIDQIQKYGDVVESLKNDWTSMAIEAGKVILPPLTDFFKAINASTEAQNLNDRAVDYALQKVAGQTGILVHNTIYWQLHAKALNEAKNEYLSTASAVSDLTVRTHEGSLANDDMARSMAADAIAEAAVIPKTLESFAKTFESGIRDVAEAQKNAQPDIDSYTRSLNYFLNLEKNGPAIIAFYQQAVDDAAKKNGENSQQYKDAAKALEDTKKNYEGAGGMVDYFNGKLDEEQAKIDAVKKSAQDANTAQAAELMKTELTAAGIAPEDVMKNVLDFERTNGLISDEAYGDALLKVQDVQDKVNAILDKQVKVDVDSSGADTVLAKIQAAMDALVDKTITVHVNYEAGGYYPQAAGGSYDVSSPTLFLAGEAGPERATFTPAGATYNNYNYGGSDNASMYALIREVKALRQELPERIGVELDKRIK